MANGKKRQIGLNDYAKRGLLPTPRASENENRQTRLTPSQKEGEHGLSLAAVVLDNQLTGPTSQLNPLFVGEMMGFPSDWLVLPFKENEEKDICHLYNHTADGEKRE